MDKHAGITGYIVAITFAPALGAHQTDSELRSRGVTRQGSNWYLVNLSWAGICGVSPGASGAHVPELAHLVGASASVEKETDI